MRAEISIIYTHDEIVIDQTDLVATNELDHALMLLWLDGEGDAAATIDTAILSYKTDVVGLALLADGIARRVEAFAQGAIGGVLPLEPLGEVADERPAQRITARIIHSKLTINS